MRYIILLFALTLSIAKASAQDVLNEVLRTSDAIINDTTKSMDERRTALFKFDAMTYMRSKILPPYVMLDKNLSKDTLNIKVRYLNEQAYAMSVYITLYQRRLKEASNKNKPLVTQFSSRQPSTTRHLRMQIQSLPWLITTPRMFLLLSASTAIGFQPWLLSAASTGQSFKNVFSQKIYKNRLAASLMQGCCLSIGWLSRYLRLGRAPLSWC